MKLNSTVSVQFARSTGLKRRCLTGFAALLVVPAVACPPKIWTTIADWNGGIRFNTQGSADAGDGSLTLVDPGDVRTFPTLWPANAGEDTVTKFDTTVNRETGRYRTWFNQGLHSEFAGPAPSRTAVDGSGNVYVVNRHFDSRDITVLKILTSDAGATDRNGNSVIDTSVDTNNNGIISGAELLPVSDDGGFGGGGVAADGFPQIAEFRDERIKWITRIPGTASRLGRSCAIDPSGNIWVGSFSPGAYYKLDGSTGAILAGPISTPGLTPYGAVVDSSGTLWSASLSSILGRVNTTTNTHVANYGAAASNYGIALDDSRRRLYLGYRDPYTRFDTAALAFSYPAALTGGGFGVSTASNGDVLVHKWSGGVARYSPAHALVWNASAQAGATGGAARGVAPDANGDVFTINLDTNNVSKFRGTDGAALGVFPIGHRPYSYSDLSGSSFIQTNLVGTWTVEHADLLRGNKNPVASWTSTGPGSVKVELAGSNTSGAPGPFTEASSGVPIPAISGKYITVRVTLQAASQVSPAVQSLTLNTCPQVADFDNNCCIDTADYAAIRAAYLTSPRPTDPKWDVNGDGRFDVADLRRVVVLYCFPGGVPCS